MNSTRQVNRRDFFKAGTAGGMVCATAALQSELAGQQRSELNLPVITARRTLGTGPASMQVSALGFGVMGMNYHRQLHPGREEMKALLRQAVEHGVTLFDTAQACGPLINEELAGEGLHPFRNKVAITTKFGHSIVKGKYQEGKLNSRPENIREVAEGSLKRLRVETIELFYQHRLDPEVPIEDVAGTLRDLIREGKVRRFGLCEVGPEIG
jgi:aryl-alcohol dehydrogenase-like predicted oxidoreductase